ncbi:hypothetical protein ACFOWM_13845, partial [Ferruginibacter yonginensis]
LRFGQDFTNQHYFLISTSTKNQHRSGGRNSKFPVFANTRPLADIFNETSPSMKRLFTTLSLTAALLFFYNYSYCQYDTLQHNEKEGNSTTNWYDKTTSPWIIPSSIALLTVVVNIFISLYSQKVALSNVEKQIKSSLALAALQFDTTLYLKNRQDWINEVRNSLSEFLTHCNLINIELQEATQNMIARKTIHEKLSLNRNKLRLALNPKIEEHEKLLESISALMNVLDIHILNTNSQQRQYDNVDFMRKADNVIVDGRFVLYKEWDKIQRAKDKENIS